MDVTAIMNGDAQMDPNDLPTVVGPVVDGECDFCKGNRLTTDSVVNMPKLRFFWQQRTIIHVKDEFWLFPHIGLSMCVFSNFIKGYTKLFHLKK